MSSEQDPRGDLEFGTIPGMIAKVAQRHAGANVVEDGEVKLTFSELEAEVRSASRALIAAGVGHGDRIAIWAPNLWEWMVAALGALSIGGVVVPINTRYKGIEAAYLLQKSGAKVLFTVAGFLGTDYVQLLADSGESTPALERIVVLRGAVTGAACSFADFLALGADVKDAEVERRAAAVRPDDLADILFTSGTTGRPKGAMCTHAQNLRAVRAWTHVTGLREGDRYLVAMPFFHSFGYKFGWFAAMMRGATTLPEAVFDAGRCLERIAKERVSVFPGPPAIYQSLLMREDLANYDLTSLRLAVTGAAVVPVELVERMRDTLHIATVITGYGLTETTGVATMCRYDDDPVTIATTSGRAIPDVEVRVVDAEGKVLGPNEPGEILVRGYNVMKGYFDAEEETAKTIDADGFLHTGDVGTMDERGYVRITDRMKDMFIVGGFNAYPAEIETVMLTQGDIAEVAVVGVPDPRLGEVGMAFVVLRQGRTATPESLIAWCRDNMANYKVPRRIELLSALPRNASNKVLKFELRERARAGN